MGTAKADVSCEISTDAEFVVSYELGTSACAASLTINYHTSTTHWLVPRCMPHSMHLLSARGATSLSCAVALCVMSWMGASRACSIRCQRLEASWTWSQIGKAQLVAYGRHEQISLSMFNSHCLWLNVQLEGQK